MNVWQIACGETGRRYDDLFLTHDVMFCGPGRYGPYDERVYGDVIERGEFTSNKIGQVRRFVSDVQPGDLVLLRSGQRVMAVGVVAEDGYDHCTTFDDVYGWDLEHTRRVIWQRQLSDELAAIQSETVLFDGRRQMPTFEGVNADHVLDPVRHLFECCQARELADLPPTPPASLTMDELGQALFDAGLAYDTAHRVCQAIARIRRLINWYDSSGMAPDRPTEHEVVAHVILPLMLALGWSEQLLAVEWHKVDLAVFWRTPTTREHCKLVCEAKRGGIGLQNVLEQAERYVSTCGLDECHRILLTDGQCFYVYERSADGWSDQPAGYVNLLKIRQLHVCPTGTDGVDTIVSLTPARVAR